LIAPSDCELVLIGSAPSVTFSRVLSFLQVFLVEPSNGADAVMLYSLTIRSPVLER
jgi:hypothetical protein